jgi:AraC family transcriptional regulator, transcriptional activator of pobA
MIINEIPEIKFSKKRNTVIEFEIMPLSNLFKRYQEGKIDFDIQSFHRPQFNMIIYIEKGYGKHFIDFQTYDYESSDLIFVARNQVHAFDITAKTKAWIILFTTEFIMNGLVHQEVRSINILFRNVLKSPIIKHLGKNETIKALFNNLAVEYKDDIKKNKIDLFRVDNSRIVEHWDIIEEIPAPEKWANKNGKF